MTTGITQPGSPDCEEGGRQTLTAEGGRQEKLHLPGRGGSLGLCECYGALLQRQAVQERRQAVRLTMPAHSDWLDGIN